MCVCACLHGDVKLYECFSVTTAERNRVSSSLACDSYLGALSLQTMTVVSDVDGTRKLPGVVRNCSICATEAVLG